MISKIFVALISISLIVSCISRNKKDKNITENEMSFQLNADSVSYIKVVKDEQEFEIRDRVQIELWINRINNSEIDYVKFGSKNKFCIYNLANDVIIEAFFMNNKFKVKGVTYKYDSNLGSW